MIDYVALAIGHALVCALGFAFVHALPLRRDRPTAAGDRAWVLACGWFAGAFIFTLQMRLLSALGIAFGRLSIGLPLAALALVLAFIGWRQGRGRDVIADALATRPQPAAAVATVGDTDRWQRVFCWLLLGWIALRFGTLLAEVAVRPLYAWDTWVQWATKARVWFALGRIVPFAPIDGWLAGNGAFYFDAAPHYPGTAPLWQVGSAVAIGRWDDSLTNFAWWFTGVALTLAVYGYLRTTGLGRVAALVGAWFVASLPILDVHIALAGYADLPIAAYITVACLAGLRWAHERNRRDLVLFALFLLALPTLKNPGKLWMLLLLPGFVVALWPYWGLRITALVAGIAALAMLAIAQTKPVILGYQLQLNPVLPWQGLAEAYFAYASWHLLWYAAAALTLLRAQTLLRSRIAPLTVTLGVGLLFLLFGFAFTNAAVWVEDQSTVNRASLHLAPLLVVWLVQVFAAWAGPAAGDPVPAPSRVATGAA